VGSNSDTRRSAPNSILLLDQNPYPRYHTNSFSHGDFFSETFVAHMRIPTLLAVFTSEYVTVDFFDASYCVGQRGEFILAVRFRDYTAVQTHEYQKIL
jgi:hypothetical protein